jgi:hypothetical protein
MVLCEVGQGEDKRSLRCPVTLRKECSKTWTHFKKTQKPLSGIPGQLTSPHQRGLSKEE